MAVAGRVTIRRASRRHSPRRTVKLHSPRKFAEKHQRVFQRPTFTSAFGECPRLVRGMVTLFATQRPVSEITSSVERSATTRECGQRDRNQGGAARVPAGEVAQNRWVESISAMHEMRRSGFGLDNAMSVLGTKRSTEDGVDATWL